MKLRVLLGLTLALILGLVVALVLGTYTPGDQRSAMRASEERQSSGGRLADFLEEMRRSHADYEPAATPADLAARVDAVVTGTIVGVKPGQSYAPTPESEAEIATSVLEVKVDRALLGDNAVVANGSVYIELPHPAFVGTGVEGGPVAPFDHAAFAATVPRSYGVFFLDDRTNEPYWDTVLDEGAGRPAGARITTPFVQGFLIEDSNGKLVSVLEPFEAMPPAWRGLGSVAEVLVALP